LIILLDTIALWALVFEDSKYHEFVIKELEGKRAYILDIQLLELLRVIYRSFSQNGTDYDAGVNKMLEISEFIRMKGFSLKNIDLRYMSTEADDFVGGVKILNSERELFKRVGPRDTWWPEIVDAIIAYKWKSLNALLYTRDSALIAYGKKNDLQYKIIRAIQSDFMYRR